MKKGIIVAIGALLVIGLGIGGYFYFSNSKKIVISFVTNNQENVSSVKIEKGETVTLPTLQKDGYVFMGWYIGDQKVESGYKFDETSVLTAKWEIEYVISFDPNGGSSIESQKIAAGGKVVKPSDPIKEGYNFKEWQLNGVIYDFDKVVTESFTLTAVWEEKKETKEIEEIKGEYKVNFYLSSLVCSCSDCECNKLTPYYTVTVKSGEKVKAPTDPTMTGKSFKEWQLNGQKFDFNKAITSNVDLFAKWQITITLSGSGSGSIIVPCDDTSMTEPITNLPKSTGTVWRSSDSVKVVKNGDTIACTNTTLYAEPSDVAAKPMIYLYPTVKTNVEVKLKNANLLTTTYPKYTSSWKVVAYPSGKLIDLKTNRELYGLYWEGKNYYGKVTNEGFVIKGEDTIKFLEEKLEILGLTEREIEEFIVYWLPQMEKNKYNYVRFATIKEINDYMPLDINPKPDTLIRIMMEFKPLNEKINVKEQKLTKVVRKGFTVVEWGGTKIN